MAMPQQDDYIEQIHRLEGLMAYAEAHGDWEELERIKERLRGLLLMVGGMLWAAGNMYYYAMLYLFPVFVLEFRGQGSVVSSQGSGVSAQ